MNDTLNVKVGDRVAWKVRRGYFEYRWVISTVTDVTETGEFTTYGGDQFNKYGIRIGKGNHFHCQLLTAAIENEYINDKRRDIAMRIVKKFRVKLEEALREPHNIPLDVLEKIAVNVDGVLE